PLLLTSTDKLQKSAIYNRSLRRPPYHHLHINQVPMPRHAYSAASFPMAGLCKIPAGQSAIASEAMKRAPGLFFKKIFRVAKLLTKNTSQKKTESNCSV